MPKKINRKVASTFTIERDVLDELKEYARNQTPPISASALVNLLIKEFIQVVNKTKKDNRTITINQYKIFTEILAEKFTEVTRE